MFFLVRDPVRAVEAARGAGVEILPVDGLAREGAHGSG